MFYSTMSTCTTSNEVEKFKESKIENYEQAVLISKGLRDHFAELVSKEREARFEKRTAASINNPILAELDIIALEDNLLDLKQENRPWWKSQASYEYKRLDLRNIAYDTAKQILGNKVYIGCSIGTYRSMVMDHLANAAATINYYKLSEELILAVILQTPNFTKKTFKELIKIVDEQTGFSASR